MTSNNEDPTMQADDTDRDDGHDGEEPAMEPDTQMSETMEPGAQAPETAEKEKRRPAAVGRVEHFTVGRARGAGQGGTRRCAASVHGDWEPPLHRPDPVELLEEQAQTRVPELVPIRYGRMLVSPFTFYRGAAYLMASDLAGGPRTGLHTQLCGDAHLSNFGGFAAPDRQLVFSLNDFDETLPGPFEWDVKRLVASFAVAGRDRGFDDKQRAAVNREVGRSYREACASSPRCGTSTSGTRGSTSRQIAAAVSSRRRAKERKRFEDERRQGADEGQHEGVRQADRRSSTASRGSSGDPPLIVPIEELAGDQVDQPRRVPPQRDPLLPAHARGRPPQAARALPVRRTPRARSSVSAASARGPGSA